MVVKKPINVYIIIIVAKILQVVLICNFCFTVVVDNI